jgi:hypothetical protein
MQKILDQGSKRFTVGRGTKVKKNMRIKKMTKASKLFTEHPNV